MNYLNNDTFTGERAKFHSSDLVIDRCVFEDGESPLKESKNLVIHDTEFRWKYPLWYCENVKCFNVTFTNTARSGVWYTNNIDFVDSNIIAPKTFRRCEGVRITNTKIPHADETLWKCKKVVINQIEATGDYFGFNSEDIEVSFLTLHGNYCFDGGKNIVIQNSTLYSKDSFWNCENVTIINSVIIGEYLGWNTKNLTLINCKIISHQGLCYIKGLKMVNCQIIDSDLCFEFCEDIDADITNEVDSIKNPISGVIRTKGVKELIRDASLIDPKKTEIFVGYEKI